MNLFEPRACITAPTFPMPPTMRLVYQVCGADGEPLADGGIIRA